MATSLWGEDTLPDQVNGVTIFESRSSFQMYDLKSVSKRLEGTELHPRLDGRSDDRPGQADRIPESGQRCGGLLHCRTTPPWSRSSPIRRPSPSRMPASSRRKSVGPGSSRPWPTSPTNSRPRRKLDTSLDKVSQRTLDLLKASHVAIYLIQNDNKTVKVASAHGTYSEQLLSHSFRVGEGITGNIIASGKSEIVNDTRHDPRTISVPGTPDRRMAKSRP